MKNFYSYILTAVVLLASSVTLNAQQKHNLSGIILDERNQPADFVTVVLFKASDSTMVQNTFSNEKGVFTFEIPTGSYFYKASLMGYATLRSNVVSITNNANKATFETLRLTSNAKSLATVTINGKKPMIERKMDRVVMNVASSAAAVGATALELLEKAPGVAVDQNDKIAMLGKQGVIIQIDGKQTYLSSADVANMLRGMQSTEIESIELITNPSSKYDASGNSGIINIKTKKGKGGGTNGSLNLGGGYGLSYRSNAGLSFNHRSEKMNFFGNYNYANAKRLREMQIDRIVNGNVPTYFSQYGDSEKVRANSNFKAGVDYFINKKNTIGFMVTGYLGNGKENMNNSTKIGSSFVQTDSSVFSPNNIKDSYNNIAYNLNYKAVLDTTGQELTADFDYGLYSGKDIANYENNYFLANGSVIRPRLLTKNVTPSTIDIRTIKLDYVLPFKHKVNVEAGLKGSWVSTDNNLDATKLVNSSWVVDETRSNQFLYDENVVAAYINLNKTFKKTSLQLGLRTEYTSSKGNSVTTNKVIKRDYLDFFPSMVINQAIDKNNDINISYSRRIDRPSYDALNPFLYYLDQYTYNKGNPFLNPQYTNNYELTYLLKKKYAITLNYSRTNDAIMEVILPNTADKSMYQTNENLAIQDTYAAVFNAPITFTKWWNSNNSINVYHLIFRADDLNGQALNNKNTSFELKTQHNFKINSSLNAEFGGKYQAPITYGVYNLSKRYNVDAGLSKSLMNNKATLKLSVNDIFNTQNANLTSAYPGLKYWLTQQNDNRSVRLNFTYRFGNNEIKPARKRSTGIEAESGRLKN